MASEIEKLQQSFHDCVVRRGAKEAVRAVHEELTKLSCEGKWPGVEPSMKYNVVLLVKILREWSTRPRWVLLEDEHMQLEKVTKDGE